jgi:hypothetical protein
MSAREYEPRYKVGDYFRGMNGLAWKITEVHRCAIGDGFSDVNMIAEGLVFYHATRPDGSGRFVRSTRDLHRLIDEGNFLWAYLGPAPSPEDLAAPAVDVATLEDKTLRDPLLMAEEFSRDDVESTPAAELQSGDVLVRPGLPDYWRRGREALPARFKAFVWTVTLIDGSVLSARRSDGREVSEAIPQGARLLRLKGGAR